MINELSNSRNLRPRAALLSLGGRKLAEARVIGHAANRANADRHAANVLPIIREVQKAGARSLREIAAALNARGVRTARDGEWHATSIKNVLERAHA
jgi:hypothetical protein